MNGQFKIVTILLLALTLGCDTTSSHTMYMLTTSVTPENSGSVSIESGEFQEGAEVTLEASSDHWNFVRWEGDYSSTQNPVTFQINNDKNIIAVFERKNYDLTVNIEGNGTVNEEIIQQTEKTSYPYESTIRLTAIPEDNWEFQEWGGDLSGSENPQSITISTSKTVSATFITLPSIETAVVKSIFTTSAISGGTITDEGGADVTIRGVCWSTSPNPTTDNTCTLNGSGSGEFESTLSELSPNTTYHVRSYALNSVGTSYGEQRTFQTYSQTVSHGYVDGVTPNNDPEFANRTYTVVHAGWGGPGGNNLWTKMNLGATSEALSATDNNADHAGWYFQFNRSQGHYHDGSDIIPSNALEETIDENSNWTHENDVCTLTLGEGWRVPTEEEWENFRTTPVEEGGMGSGANEAFNSLLKLHTSGALGISNNINDTRGSTGYFWSSTQLSNEYGFRTYFSNTGNEAKCNNKNCAFAVRCILD